MDLTGFIAENLYSAHAFLAGLSGKDILKLEQSEADQLGQSIQNVARHYDIPGVDQKTVDWIRLARTLGMIYGTRLFAARMSAPAKPKGDGPKPDAPRVVVDNANPAKQQQQETAGGRWASPGPGLPNVWMPNQ